MKTKINYISVILLIFLLESCNSNNSVIGKYNNIYEIDAVHFVEFKNDSTYLHYYKKGLNNPKENIGKWKLINNKHKVEIMFDTWIDYGYEDKPTCNECMNFVQLKNGELLFNYDLPKETNFIKE